MFLEGSYNYYIVGLSIVIAILASYSALSITSKLSYAAGRMKYFWLLSGALVMGSGVWSMHFVGMLAFHLHIPVKYDGWLTVFSMTASVISSFIAFYITMPKNVNRYKLAVGGLVMGSGIVTMHYMGMEAMVMSAQLSYNPFYWGLSAVIALVASYAALFLFLRFRNDTSSSFLKWLSAVVMGFAICGMHYTGMKAARFQGHVHEVTEQDAVVDLFLLYGVTATIFLILLVSWAGMFFDRHVLERMAFEDTITGLPNRNAMNRFFDTHVGKESIGVLFLDLDQFKAINDTLGHDIGDMLVQRVGDRLRRFVQADQQAFRIGGDEFLIVAKHCDRERAEQLAGEIIRELKQGYQIEGNELYVTGSIGISIGVIDSSARSMLLKAADTAMYKAKSLGKNQYCVYSEEMGAQEVRKLELEKDLKRAVEKDEFFIVYQPKWDVKESRLYGFEALLRWQHPRLGIVSPAEFIPIAEETGLIIPMTKRVLEEACRECRSWHVRGIYQPVSVNLSIRLFQTDSLSEMVREVLEQTGMDSQFLELEITETMIFYDVQDIIKQLHSIRAMGVRVSMDDFGTGYSSIGLLDQIPIDALKLDRSFTNDIGSPSKRAIIHAIVLMAEKLKLDVIAEGVENEEHIEWLTQLGCYVMQGYYYGSPMKTEEMNQYLRNNQGKTS